MNKFVVFTGILAVCMAMWTLPDAEAMCLDSADCAPTGCCTVANMPYPTPTCNRYRTEGDSCKPNNKPFNTTTYTPHGSPWYNATNLYSNLCPCAPGLACTSGKCVKI